MTKFDILLTGWGFMWTTCDAKQVKQLCFSSLLFCIYFTIDTRKQHYKMKLYLWCKTFPVKCALLGWKDIVKWSLNQVYCLLLSSNKHPTLLWDLPFFFKWLLFVQTIGDPVVAAEFHPLVDNHLVSCGKGHILFWSLENNKLTKKAGIFEVTFSFFLKFILLLYYK